MADQLVTTGAGDPLDQHHIGGVLEHGPMALLQDVAQVFRRAPAGRIVLAHIAEPAGKLGEPLAIGRVALPLDRKMGGLDELGFAMRLTRGERIMTMGAV
jgi:hypothetical protein